MRDKENGRLKDQTLSNYQAKKEPNRAIENIIKSYTKIFKLDKRFQDVTPDAWDSFLCQIIHQFSSKVVDPAYNLLPNSGIFILYPPDQFEKKSQINAF